MATCLVVYLPLWKIWVCQLELLFPTEWKDKIHVPSHQSATIWYYALSEFTGSPEKKNLLNGRPKMVADGLDGLLNGPFHDSLIEVSMATIRIFAVLTRYSIYLSTYPSIYASICTLHSGKYVGIYWYWHIPLFIGIVHIATTKK